MTFTLDAPTGIRTGRRDGSPTSAFLSGEICGPTRQPSIVSGRSRAARGSWRRLLLQFPALLNAPIVSCVAIRARDETMWGRVSDPIRRTRIPRRAALTGRASIGDGSFMAAPAPRARADAPAQESDYRAMLPKRFRPAPASRFECSQRVRGDCGSRFSKIRRSSMPSRRRSRPWLHSLDASSWRVNAACRCRRRVTDVRNPSRWLGWC